MRRTLRTRKVKRRLSHLSGARERRRRRKGPRVDQRRGSLWLIRTLRIVRGNTVLNLRPKMESNQRKRNAKDQHPEMRMTRRGKRRRKKKRNSNPESSPVMLRPRKDLRPVR